MQIYISKAFSSALSGRSENEIKLFKEKIDILKSKNKTDIIALNDVVELTNEKNFVLYAYNLQASVYVLFAFKEKNKLILLDEIELISKDKIKSLVYSNETKQDDPAQPKSEEDVGD